MARERRGKGAREGSGPRLARTSTQRLGGGCVARVRRGGRRFSLADLSGCTALSRDHVCFFTRPISRFVPRLSDCIRRFAAAHQMTNKFQNNQNIWQADKCAMRLRSCMSGCSFCAPVPAAQWPFWRLRGDPRHVGVATKSPRSSQKQRMGRTADDRWCSIRDGDMGQSRHITCSTSSTCAIAAVGTGWQ